VADAAAVAVGRPEDYAQFLLDWAKAPAAPSGATGVKGRSSDLLRRISMLLHSGIIVEKACPRRWSRLVASGLLGLAVVGGGIGLRAIAAPAPEKKEAVKEEPKKETKKESAPADDKADAKKEEKPGLKKPMIPSGVLPAELEEIFKNLQPLDGDFADVQKQLEASREQLQKALERARLPGARAERRHMAPRRLGVMVEMPSAALRDQLDLPKDQGLVLVEIQPDSAAAKAGFKAHDVLLELDGKPVPADVAQFQKDLAAIKADANVDAVILRKGRKETVKGLTLPEAKPVTEARRFPILPRLNQGFPGLPLELDVNGRVHGKIGAPAGSQISVVRTNDNFTAKERDGDRLITVTGKVADGKATVNEITIKDGSETNRYDSMDKVPEAHRAKVKALADMASKGEVRP